MDELIKYLNERIKETDKTIAFFKKKVNEALKRCNLSDKAGDKHIVGE